VSQVVYAQLPQLEYIDDIIKYIFGRQTSTFIMGFGRRESGKTDFMLEIMEILYNAEMIESFATNVKIYQSPFPIEHITSMPDLEAWCQTDPRKKLFGLDEAGKALRRRTPMAKLNIELIDNLQILRKYKLSTIMLAPADKYIDGASLGSDVLDGYYIKPEFKNPKIGLYTDLLEKFTKHLKDIPPTSVKFDTWDVAPFTLKGKKEPPKFNDSDKQMAYDWSHGKTWRELVKNPNELNRVLRRFVRRSFDMGIYDLPTSVCVKSKENDLQTTS
jgi:hypothetical protein